MNKNKIKGGQLYHKISYKNSHLPLTWGLIDVTE